MFFKMIILRVALKITEATVKTVCSRSKEKVNLLIGANNCGKSNRHDSAGISRFLRHLIKRDWMTLIYLDTRQIQLENLRQNFRASPA